MRLWEEEVFILSDMEVYFICFITYFVLVDRFYCVIDGLRCTIVVQLP